MFLTFFLSGVIIGQPQSRPRGEFLFGLINWFLLINVFDFQWPILCDIESRDWSCTGGHILIPVPSPSLSMVWDYLCFAKKLSR